METIATYILDALIAVLIGLITRFAVPYIKSKLTAENLSFVKTWVNSLVAAAEQTIQGSGMGAAKKAWVISMLEKLEITVDEKVDALIESAVLALNQAVGTAADTVTEALEDLTAAEDTETAAATETEG